MKRLQRIFSGAGGMGPPATDGPILDSKEQVYIYLLSLLKMLKHGTYFLNSLSIHPFVLSWKMFTRSGNVPFVDVSAP